MIQTKRKTIIGIILIVISVAALIFWETAGRELCTTTEVLAAGKTLRAGEAVSAEAMSSVRLPIEGAAKSWLSPGQAALLEGRICAVDIEAGEPLTEAMFREKNRVLENGFSIFSIPKEWIASRPSMLRAGDEVTLYSLPAESEEGTFEIAFTRDSAQQAITGDELSSSDVLSRNTSSGIIESVEIICRPEDYFRLYELSLTSGMKAAKAEAGEDAGADLSELGGFRSDGAEEDAVSEEDPEEGPESFVVYEPGEPFLLMVLKEAR